MSKSSKEDRRVGSQQKKEYKPMRKTSTVELQQLKEKGKKVLKKIIPNQPLVMIKRLYQMGADNFKKQLRIGQQLLPLLTTNKIQSLTNNQPQSMLIANPSHNSHFEQINRQLTSTMLNFQSTLTETIQNNSKAELVRLQTDKCYHRIPNQFFMPEMPSQFIEGFLSRDPRVASQTRDQFMDHYDEVEFNVHQQVGYKMGIFMSFVSFLSSIGGLAELSIGKIKVSRARNTIVKERVVQRAARVYLLRTRKQELELYLHVLGCLKGLKKIETKLILEVQTKGRVTSLQDYPDYCRLHDSVKEYCCPKMLCKFWDLAYYIQRSYHDSFSRSLKSYLAQIIVADEKQLQEIMSPNKSVFATFNITTLNSNLDGLDQSYEVEEEVELIIKHNIEKEIVALLRQGLNKCTYSTDQLCSEITEQLTQIESSLYAIITKPNHVLTNKFFSPAEKKNAMEKLTTAKYLRVVELWSQRLKKVVSRQVSIIDKALKVVSELGKQQPQKQEVIASYLMQIIYITFSFIDSSIAQIIGSRKFKQQESDSIRQLLIYEQQWKELVQDLNRYTHLWQELARHFSQEEQQEDHRPKLKHLITNCLLTGMSTSRRKIVELMVDSYNSICIEKLPVRLQEQEWKVISILPSFYNTLGEVLYGRCFTKEVQKLQQKMLSSSLLLQKNASFMSINEPLDTSQAYDEISRDAFTQFQVNETVVKLNGDSYRIIASTIAVVQWIQGYLEWAQEAGVGECVQGTVLSKVMQFLMMYNTHIKELILNKAALNYGKIKAKSITGKHLLIAYSQLKLLKAVSGTMAQRLPNFRQLSEIICDRLQKTMGEISKKFRTILELSLRESINKLVVDPRRDIASPVAQTTEIVGALTRSCDYVRELLMSQKQIGQFVSVNWCSQYLEQIRAQYKAVYRQIMNSNGTRKSKDIDWTDNLYWKFKELEYLVHNLEEIGYLLPGFDVIMQELEQERTKLDRPQ